MSKELDALSRIVGCSTIESHRPKWQKDYKLIETALKEHELMKEIRITARFDLAQVNKEHKALEIIKKKEVNVRFLISCKTLKEYNDVISDHLTQEEYDLLKEVLLCK